MRKGLKKNSKFVRDGQGRRDRVPSGARCSHMPCSPSPCHLTGIFWGSLFICWGTFSVWNQKRRYCQLLSFPSQPSTNSGISWTPAFPEATLTILDALSLPCLKNTPGKSQGTPPPLALHISESRGRCPNFHSKSFQSLHSFTQWNKTTRRIDVLLWSSEEGIFLFCFQMPSCLLPNLSRTNM